MTAKLPFAATWLDRYRWPILGTVVGFAVFAWWFPRNDLAEMGRAMRAVDPSFIATAMLLVLLNMILRAARWMILLGRGARSRSWQAFSALMIGYLANNVLPARGGDLVRVYAYGIGNNMPRSKILATVVVERVLDMAAIVVVVGAVAAASPIPPWMRQGGALLAGGTAAGVAGLLLIRFLGNYLLGFALRPLSARMPALASRLAWMGHEFIAGLGTLRGPAAAPLFFLLTGGIWLLEISIVLTVARAYALPLSAADSVVLMLFSLFSSMIPALPGQFGLYEVAIMAGLEYCGHGGPAALPFALGLHLVLIASTTLIGLICLLRSGFSLFEARSSSSQPQGG